MASRSDDDEFPELSKESIAERLRITRAVFGYSQGEFGAKAGLKANTYNQYEQAIKRPSLGSAAKLCKTYGLTMDWIFLGDQGAMEWRLVQAIKSVREARD